MVLSPDKCSFMLFDNVTIRNSEEQKVLGITYDNKLDFSTYLTSITKKANIKRNTFTRVKKYVNPEQKTFLSSSKSQFN